MGVIFLVLYIKTNCSLRQVDLEMMKRLHRKVNIVVVIAKADTLTAAEVKRLKTRILNDLDENQIQVSDGIQRIDILRKVCRKISLKLPSSLLVWKDTRYARVL